MIREVSGDILLSQADVIAHGVAPADHFDTGLALALRERWPALAKDFRQRGDHCIQQHFRVGRVRIRRNRCRSLSGYRQRVSRSSCSDLCADAHR